MQRKKIARKEYFSSKEYGVKPSERVYYGRNIPKGGGYHMVGKPYNIRGIWYKPHEDLNYDKIGMASWYGESFHGRLTANGEIYDKNYPSAAHPTFPLPSYARVTSLETGSSLIVRVNDRGPYYRGRIIDLSHKAAELLSIQNKGVGMMRVTYLGKARLDGKDKKFLLSSFKKNNGSIKLSLPKELSHHFNVGLPNKFSSLAANNFPILVTNAPIPLKRPDISQNLSKY
ncbi:Rare lipoprotein A precursor [Liberibacter crescens BT-1]|uniref:Endolytic peptidoglycan transglycosylase RlpA n=2 Tax=Liberibacter crescens TaxID=1273132 RepID=L0EUW2_LIBCB|nr:Rare lipoprotein A precursor [Liberibacter crescens BT-1]